MTSILDKIEVHDAGERIVLSCADEATLRAAISEIRRDGAQGVQHPVKVGSKWIASFANPRLEECRVERIGYQIVITGPTPELVMTRSHEFRERGALTLYEPAFENGVWKLTLDDVGTRIGQMVSL